MTLNWAGSLNFGTHRGVPLNIPGFDLQLFHQLLSQTGRSILISNTCKSIIIFNLIKTLKRKSNMELSRISPQFALHGKYVGPGHTGGPTLGSVNFDTRPVDELDDAARNHDWQYRSEDDAERRLADYVLSQRALLASSRLSGVSKLKAYGVGYGMYLKALLGRGDATKARIRDAPPLRLVGVETNPGPQPSKAFIRGQRVNPPKKNPTKPPQPNNQPKPKNPKNQNQTPRMSKQMRNAILTQQMFNQPKSSVYPSGLPVIDEVNVLPSQDFWFGDVKIKPMIAPATIIGNGQIFYTIRVDRTMFADTPAAKKFEIFGRWGIEFVTLKAVPALATNTNGLAYIAVMTDPNDAPVVGTVKPETWFAGRNARQHSVFGAPWKVTLKGEGKHLYTDQPFHNVSSNVVSIDDKRLDAAGVFVFAASDGFGTTSADIASLRVIARLHFWNAEETEDDGVLCCVKAQSINSSSVQSITGGAATYVTDLFNAIVTAPKTYVEGVYQDFYYDGIYFNFPPGDYYFQFSLFLSGDPGNTAFSPNFGSGVFSSDAAATHYSDTWGPEFNKDPPNLVSPVYKEIYSGTLRVETPSTGSPYLTLQPQVQYTNNVNILGGVFLCYRLPTSIGHPQASHYPMGNSGGSVSYTSNGGVAGPAFKCKPASQSHVIITKSELEEFRTFQRNKNNSVVMDVVTPKIQEIDDDFPEHKLQSPHILNSGDVAQVSSSSALTRSLHLPASLLAKYMK